MFVDTRLHVSVRPSLEYKLPDAARVVRGALLGDGRHEDAIAALHGCLPEGPPPSTRAADGEEEEALTRMFGEEDALHRQCARVCTHARDYLEQISSEWRAHLNATRLAVQRITRELDRQSKEAASVRRRYRERNPTVVDEEYRIELARLRAELDAELERLRAFPHPSVERPAALAESTHALKEAFANAYGTFATSRLTQLRAHFESEMDGMQHEVANEFVKCTVALL